MIQLRLRSLPREGPARERGPYHYTHASLEPGRTAFVLVDVWSEHGSPTHHERAQQIIENKIVPAVAAARVAGMHIIHAPAGRAIAPAITVLPRDHVHGLAPMDDLFRKLELDNLLYVGFATNGCVMGRPYGIAATHKAHRAILLRDATTGTEYPDTLDNLCATRAAIGRIERHYGYTVLTEEFIDACCR